MPLFEEEELNKFLQESLSCIKKDEPSPITLDSSQELTIEAIRAKIDDGSKESVIEIVYVDEKGCLVKKSNSDENISIIKDSPFEMIDQSHQLVIRKKSLDSDIAGLYRLKKENNKIVLEYLGEKKLPALLSKTQSAADTSNNDENYEEQLDDNGVNVIKRSEDPMKLSFAIDGTCCLSIDDKKKTIVPVNISDAKEFRKFVANQCPHNGTINIEIDKNGKILFAYIINNDTHKRKDIKINEKLIPTLERVISTASSLHSQYSQNNCDSPKKQASDNKSFSAEKVDANQPSPETVAKTATNLVL